MKTPPSQPDSAEKRRRQQRLAEALRANLKRRKAAGNGRKNKGPADTDPPRDQGPSKGGDGVR